MYEPLILIHSWTRWIVLGAAVYFLGVCITALVRGRRWDGRDARFAWALDQVLGYQVLFGLALWVAASPIVHASFLNYRAILEDPLYTFWTVRHPLTMLAALGAFQVGKVVARGRTVTSRFRVYAWTLVITLVLIVSAIPWPGLSYGRALFRLF